MISFRHVELRFCVRILLYFLLALMVYATAVSIRREVLQAQYQAHGYDLPFTLESALYFRRVKMLYDRGGQLPEQDPMIYYPKGITTRETYTFGAEYVQAALMDLFPDRLSPEQKLRWIDCLWFSLGIPLLGIWIAVRTRSRWGGVVAAVFYAVALSSVIRSTGQELSRENAALPLLIGFLMSGALAETASRVYARNLWALISAGCLAGALWTWDLVQFPIALWALAQLWIFVVRPQSRTPGGRLSASLACLGLGWVGLVNPYYQSHGFLLSPVFGLCAGVFFCSLIPGTTSGAKPVFSSGWGRLVLAAGPVLVLAGWSWASSYGEAYSHFSSLLVAKLMHGNVKPVDPSLLTFDQRVMWVPALHSADLTLTRLYFPAMLTLVVVMALPVFHYARRTSFPELIPLGWYLAVSVVAYILFVRFHVFVALFASAWLGMAVGIVRRCGRFSVQWFTGVLILMGITAEARRTLDRPERWGRVNVYLSETRQLTDWLEANLAPYPVLANMGISGSIAAYGKCAVALHPKFEQPEIRERYRAYGEALFGTSEEGFRDFVESLGIRYYVYAKGEFAPVGESYQMRYFVNRLDAGEESPAWAFERAPETLHYFYPLWSNRKYSVFAMRTRADEQQAGELLEEARLALSKGFLGEAKTAAIQAWQLDPRLTNAVELLGTVQSLEASGFEDQQAHEP